MANVIHIRTFRDIRWTGTLRVHFEETGADEEVPAFSILRVTLPAGGKADVYHGQTAAFRRGRDREDDDRALPLLHVHQPWQMTFGHVPDHPLPAHPFADPLRGMTHVTELHDGSIAHFFRIAFRVDGPPIGDACNGIIELRRRLRHEERALVVRGVHGGKYIQHSG